MSVRAKIRLEIVDDLEAQLHVTHSEEFVPGRPVDLLRLFNGASDVVRETLDALDKGERPSAEELTVAVRTVRNALDHWLGN